jgi:Tfp pilus assembly protein PilF
MGVLFVLVVALLLSRKRRGVVAAMLLFVGTLFPALGFFNVYPHRYSFVADHFQHLASIALTTLICAGIVVAIRKLIQDERTRRIVFTAISIVIVATLAALTFRQSKAYESAETLWADAARKSPNQWIVWTSLGKLAADDPKRIDEAIGYHERAHQLAPHVADTWYNLGAIRAQQQRWDEAEAAFKRSAEIAQKNRPGSAVELDSLIGLARIAYLQRNDPATAEAYLKQAIALRPEYPLTYLYYAIMAERLGRIEEAYDLYVTAVERMPANFDAHYNLGNLLMQLGHPSAASDMFRVAVQVNPKSAQAWTNLGAAELQLGRRGNARIAFSRALSIDPNLEPAQRGLQAAGG